jgi:hypothetical protein
MYMHNYPGSSRSLVGMEQCEVLRVASSSRYVVLSQLPSKGPGKITNYRTAVSLCHVELWALRGV